MSKASRDKGMRVEREMVKRHIDIGCHSERVPLSGAAHYQGNGGDIDVYAFGRDECPIVGEVKARKNGAGFVTLENWLGPDNDFLLLKRNNADPMVVLPWRMWARILEALA